MILAQPAGPLDPRSPGRPKGAFSGAGALGDHENPDRLRVEKSIDDAAQDALVPSLILQPLIENAIKYAISPSEDGGTLRISAKVQQDMLLLQLSDTGPGLGNGDSKQKSSGVGLKNTRERLQQLYGDRQAFTLGPNQPHGLVVTINIPFEVSND